MKFLRGVESVGWGFYGIMCLVLGPPVTYVVYGSLYDTVTVGTRIAGGVITALILAAFVTYGINEALYRTQQRRIEVERKAEKKEEKRRNKPKAKSKKKR